MPFKSGKQERYLQINEPELYEDWVEEYGHFKGAESFGAEDFDAESFASESRGHGKQKPHNYECGGCGKRVKDYKSTEASPRGTCDCPTTMMPNWLPINLDMFDAESFGMDEEWGAESSAEMHKLNKIERPTCDEDEDVDLIAMEWEDYSDALKVKEYLDAGRIQDAVKVHERLDTASRDKILDYIDPKYWQQFGYMVQIDDPQEYANLQSRYAKRAESFSAVTQTMNCASCGSLKPHSVWCEDCDSSHRLGRPCDCNEKEYECEVCETPFRFNEWNEGYEPICGSCRNPICQACWDDHYTGSRCFSAESFAAELKRDSCCCGATKSNPCACMIQGVMKCDATCPCSLEKKDAESFESEQIPNLYDNCVAKLTSPHRNFGKPKSFEKATKICSSGKRKCYSCMQTKKLKEMATIDTLRYFGKQPASWMYMSLDKTPMCISCMKRDWVEDYGAESFSAERYFEGAIGDEGMFKGGEIRINDKAKPAYVIYYLDEQGNKVGDYIIVTKHEFERTWSPFEVRKDMVKYHGESFSAKGVSSFSPTRLMVLGASVGAIIGLYTTRGD